MLESNTAIYYRTIAGRKDKALLESNLSVRCGGTTFKVAARRSTFTALPFLIRMSGPKSDKLRGLGQSPKSQNIRQLSEARDICPDLQGVL